MNEKKALETIRLYEEASRLIEADRGVAKSAHYNMLPDEVSVCCAEVYLEAIEKARVLERALKKIDDGCISSDRMEEIAREALAEYRRER